MTAAASADVRELAGSRLLLFSHESTLSGAPTALLHLALWLQEKGCPPVVAMPEPGPIATELQRHGVEVILNPDFLIGPHYEAAHELCRGFDIVLANTLASWPVARAAKVVGARVVWYLHETLVARQFIARINEIPSTLAMADLLVAPTRQTSYIYSGLVRTPIEVVPYGIPEPQLEARAPGDGSLRFVSLGSYEPRKGQDLLLSAIELSPAHVRQQALFTFAGRVLDESFFAGLKERADRFKNIELGAALERDASLQFLAESDVMVCSSRDETMPLAIIEAMSLGKAVVTAEVGGVSEWLEDGLNALVVPAEDPGALAAALRRCVEDRVLVRQLGATARRTFVRHFGIDCFGSRFASLLARFAAKDLSRPPTDYERWMAEVEAPNAARRLALRRALGSIVQLPLFSILLPVYNPELTLLRSAIDSVRQQVYECWELCIADDASTDPRVREFLEKTAAADPRIKVCFRLENGHISACSNTALSLADGDWCGLLDQDDRLHETALAAMALEISRHPSAGLIYSDEDKIDAEGARSNAFFKPDWNPELFLGQNYINHFGLYLTSLLREIGGFRGGFEGSQDYDLALRCIERLRPEQIRHVPQVLYHWRMVPGSLAAVADAKPYAKHAARRALADHLQRRGIAGRAEACPENPESHRVIYDLPQPAPLVSIIIPVRDRTELLRGCLQSLRERTDYTPWELIIVDNASREPETHTYLAELERTRSARVLRDAGPFNFSRLNNRAAAVASGTVLLFLNNDIEARNPDWLREMVSQAERPGVGAVGARLWYPDETLQHGGVIVGLGGVAGHPFHRFPRGHPGYFNRLWLQQNCTALSAACLAVRKDLFDSLGGFDEGHLGVSFNDVDLCLRLRARGLQNVWTPYANLTHYESASRGHQTTPNEQAQFVREAICMQEKWAEELLNDPFYSKNFSLHWPGFELAFPPRWFSRSRLASPEKMPCN